MRVCVCFYSPPHLPGDPPCLRGGAGPRQAESHLPSHRQPPAHRRLEEERPGWPERGHSAGEDPKPPGYPQTPRLPAAVCPLGWRAGARPRRAGPQPRAPVAEQPCPVPLQVRNGTLSIAAVERASAGAYTCHASSEEGTVTHTTRVLVQGKSCCSPRHLGAVGVGTGQGRPLAPALAIPSRSTLQGPPSSWCHPRTSPSTSPKMPFWRARPRRTRETSPTPGSRAAATSSTSGTAARAPRRPPAARWGWRGAWRGASLIPGQRGPSQPSLPFPYSHLRARVRVLVDGSLLLQRTTPDDAGKYTCIPSNGLWKPPSASAFVTVLCKSPREPGCLHGGARRPARGAAVGRGCPFSSPATRSTPHLSSQTRRR